MFTLSQCLFLEEKTPRGLSCPLQPSPHDTLEKTELLQTPNSACQTDCRRSVPS